jgi:hypothetical protein
VAPTSAALLAAWEAGASEAHIDRAPSLLRSLDAIAPEIDPAQLSVGQCDARLFRLRRAVFGDLFEAVATCPACGEEVDLELSLADVQPAEIDGELPTGTLAADGFQIAYRLPRNEDLRAVAARGAAAGACDLLERCVVDARAPDGERALVGELPPAIAESVLKAMAESDPGAHVELEIRCPCGACWLDELDIRRIVWADLTDWVGRTLTEVQQLATVYGWSETEILAMAPWRRGWYLEAAGA